MGKMMRNTKQNRKSEWRGGNGERIKQQLYDPMCSFMAGHRIHAYHTVTSYEFCHIAKFCSISLVSSLFRLSSFISTFLALVQYDRVVVLFCSLAFVSVAELLAIIFLMIRKCRPRSMDSPHWENFHICHSWHLLIFFGFPSFRLLHF